MPPRKRSTAASTKALASLPNGPIAEHKTRGLSASLSSNVTTMLAKFPLVVLSSMFISAALYSIGATFLAGDLAHITRQGADWWEIAGWMACKIGEMLFVWLWGFDGTDLVALTTVSHFPVYFLFNQFYSIRPSTCLWSIFTDILAASIPFALLRPALPAHAKNPPPGSVADRFLIHDMPTKLITAALGAALHGVLLFASYRTWMPSHLVSNFYPLATIDAAKAPNINVFVFNLLPLGIAMRTFLFTPALATPADERDHTLPDFDPASATLSETFAYTFWGWSARTRELIKRAAIVAGVTFMYTFVQLTFTVRGVEPAGAAGWAGFWSIAGLATAAVYGWVGHLETDKAEEEKE